MVDVELIYAPLKEPLIHLHFSLLQGTSVAQVLEISGLFKTHPEIRDFSVGIFSKQVALNHLVKHGDRIEIYRPLTLGPMEKRRQRAKNG